MQIGCSVGTVSVQCDCNEEFIPNTEQNIRSNHNNVADIADSNDNNYGTNSCSESGTNYVSRCAHHGKEGEEAVEVDGVGSSRHQRHHLSGGAAVLGAAGLQGCNGLLHLLPAEMPVTVLVQVPASRRTGLRTRERVW